jgi:peptidoglycan/LPS O-acetylase OafA/YrhL
VPFDTLDIMTYQIPFILGIVWKMYDDKAIGVQDWMAKHKMASIGISLSLLAITVMVRMYPVIPHWSGIRVDGFLSSAIALCVITILLNSKCLMAILAFLGKHSMNIYMIHTFINAFWCAGWLHSCEWRRGGVNFAILMLICLAISAGVECMKEKVGLYKLMKIITNRI